MWLSEISILEAGTRQLNTGISDAWLPDTKLGYLGKLGTTANTNGCFYTESLPLWSLGIVPPTNRQLVRLPADYAQVLTPLVGTDFQDVSQI